ncbi:uncharacterized protein [Rutidosis leptorrhynchoides]|uniref:uncharacterized protein n=1 Tax=Rutidosis leptorrhynchoides TaxID=125765 RepID=UPI003A998723
MGFSSVYRVLQEVFPQVDSRVLKAVAIEHSKDADGAVEAVLVEVLPKLPKPSPVVSSVNASTSFASQSEDRSKGLKIQEIVDLHNVNSHFQEQSSVDHSSSSNETSTALVGDSSFYDANDETEDADDARLTLITSKVLVENVPSLDNSVISERAVSGSVHDGDHTLALNASVSASASAANYNNYIHLDVDTLKLDASATVLKDDEYVHMDVDNETITASGINCEKVVADITCESGSSSLKSGSEKGDDFEAENVGSEDESNMTSVLTNSLQNCNTELLEEIIEDARNNKDALVSAMNSVVDLMKEVESKEKAAEEAKEEANRGCSDIYAKVDELKQALNRAKEANDMHAGEVHAEKAILATELKELQFRLFTLSDERNKSLEILEEMRKALEVRLAAALEEIKAAEEGKLEKVKLAKEALVSQESEMETVVEESKRLKLEAEENTKLQEFLMDRGRAIDILQGEFSVKFQDVLLLKEKFDKRIPLSRSLSSSEKSSILASSSSSFRSTVFRVDYDQETFETPKKGAELDNSYEVFDNNTKYEETNAPPKSETETTYPVADNGSPYVDEKKLKDRKALIEAEWELFENEDFMIRN